MKNAFKQYFDLLIKYLKPQSRRVVQMGLLLFTSIGLQLLGPQIIRYFIDTVVSRGAIDNLARAALFFILVVFARQLASALATYLSEDVGWTATNSLRTDLVLHCLGLDISFHKAHTPGELIERIDGDVMMLSNLFSQFVFRVLGSVILLLGILTLAFIEDWRVGLMMTVSTLIALYVLRQTQGIAIPHHRAFRQSVADTTSFWEEA
ncbi:MAG TPA: ABC transporter transmembrane domain-containing protein, partial [Blastocatellia bacterium]